MRIGIITMVLLGALPVIHGETTFDLSLNVQLGDDRGQPLGSLFEARNENGEIVFGAGFDDGHSTYIRDNNRQVVFYCKPVGRDVNVTGIGKPYSHEHNATRLLADRNGLVVFKRFGNPQRILGVGEANTFQPYAPDWTDTPAGGTLAGTPAGFCGLQYVDNRPLVFYSDRILYDGRAIYTSKRGSGMYYYSQGTLLIFHYKPQRVFAIRWSPSQPEPIRLENAKEFPVEGSVFVFGTYDDGIHLVTNIGNYYIYSDGALRQIRESDGKSWQAYSMVRVYDDLLIGHYPTGSLYLYDGDGLRELEPPIPVPKEVSSNAREAQTLAIHGGYVYAGVWPWGELWRYDPDTKTWTFVTRVFELPIPNRENQEPFAQAMKDKSDVYNYWGQRITSLTNVGDSMYIATMNKQGMPYKPEEHDFMTPEILAQYGKVHRLRSNAQVAAPFRWKTKTQFRFVYADGKLEIHQDGQLLGSTTCKADGVRGPYKIRKSYGIYGPFAGMIE